LISSRVLSADSGSEASGKGDAGRFQISSVR
jgi:hypothetical protein